MQHCPRVSVHAAGTRYLLLGRSITLAYVVLASSSYRQLLLAFYTTASSINASISWSWEEQVHMYATTICFKIFTLVSFRTFRSPANSFTLLYTYSSRLHHAIISLATTCMQAYIGPTYNRCGLREINIRKAHIFLFL